jgi:hypothetical protein
MSTIVRLYETSKQAHGVVSDLKKNGFADEEITLVAPAGAGETGTGAHNVSGSGMAASIMSRGVSEASAKVCAQSVGQGKWLVIVRAPFGSTTQAIGIMQAFDPIDAAVGPEYSESSTDGTLSLGSALPVLWRGRSSTALLTGRSTTRLLTGRSSTKLLGRDDSLSSWLHIPQIVRSGKTLCSQLGIPEISGPARKT